MNGIKFLKADVTTGLQKIKLNGVIYKPYTICDLPNQFGMVEEITNEDGDVVARLSVIDEWFNYKGLTYIIE
tara:strand:+ start:8680 stop:8895 length:216 start_codon:yes stop_codon:yes gene_type:complete